VSCIPTTFESVATDQLISSDFFWDIVGRNKMMLPSGMFIFPSKFGYIITGRYADTKGSLFDGKLCTLFVGTEMNQVIPELCIQNTANCVNPQLEYLWCLENIGIVDPPFVDSDDEAPQKFNEMVMLENGRYQITWPWKNNGFQLSDNYHVAMARMRMLVKCLHSDKDLLHKYDKIIKNK